MEESTSQENAQSVPSLEEKMYKIDYETTDYVYYRDDRLERILRGFAYGILVSGIISVIWSFCTFCFVEEPYFVNSFNVEDSIKTRTVFKIEGIFISLAIAFSTISSFTFLMVFCNMSLTLKDIKHRINYGQMTVIKHPLPQSNKPSDFNIEEYASGEGDGNTYVWACIAIFLIAMIIMLILNK